MANTPRKSEEEIVALLQAGDRSVMEYLYDHYSAALYGVCLKVVQDETAAQDVLQEGFVKIWKRGAKYDPTKGKLFTWMLNVVRNTAIDYLRSKAVKYEINGNERVSHIIETNSSQEMSVDGIGLRKHLLQLRKEEREIIELSYFGGYTQDEISKELKIPLGTVKTRARRALTDLRKLIGTNGGY
ncbi:MAG: sigma-70 family RNA polymerase sigma factor [Bacteroidetes bacterium]|uniref:Sigma-70 family RNA polymerase sigma factor n=2 Tax=Phaeocystidibacter marisrubri TaxID=1577780 RepID=A0A6L3ZCC9_9FLAO|nr:sigma-70 family RNA polymerase sigma factor [Phaeocystidibacter marisrubri]TNE27285.1 MAG: sigma-70 family RNA polymerase sigma factor [Bacteroidota bacterium]